jgi:arylsulfatase A-like enzyme
MRVLSSKLAAALTAAVALAAACSTLQAPSPTPALVATATPSPVPSSTPEPPPAPARTAVVPQPPVEQPNFVLIITDDQPLSTMAYMPLTRRLLAERGATFDNYFVTDPLCCPSRATVLRGQYPHNHQVLSNGGTTGGFRRFRRLGHETSTVATWLQEAGYRTALMGKYLNGYPAGEPGYVPPGWSEWYATTDPRYYDYTLNENGQGVYHGTAPTDYETDVVSRKAVDFINRASADGAPFFLYLAPFAPHTPSTPALRHQEVALDVKAPRGGSFDEEDTSDKPVFVQEFDRLDRQQLDAADRSYRLQVQSLQAVDELVDAVVATLEAAGLTGSTYVLFTSDNGFHYGEHRLPQGKGMPYDHDVRVPLIVAGPGVPAGRHVKQLALNNDLAPTLAAIAGARAPQFIDGRSLWPLLAADDADAVEWRDAFAIEFWVDDESQRPAPPYSALRTARWLYVEWSTGERELYDMAADPDQLQNVYSGADPQQVASLARLLQEIVGCSSGECVEAEDAGPP